MGIRISRPLNVVSWSALLVAFVMSASFASSDDPPPRSGAEVHRSPPPAGAKTHTVVPGERYKANPFKRWLLGNDYRYLWKTPVDVPVLDLDAVGGGLTPVRTGGYGQSISLHFNGADGRRYQVRSLDKDPTKRIPDKLKDTIVSDALQDQISSMHPTAALVVDPLLDATGILHMSPTLVVIPDDPRLGEFRDEFAGLIGLLELHASEGPDDTPGFAGSRKVSSSEKLIEHLEKGPKQRVDARMYLKARFMDFVIGDRDRHPGQWRWARFPEGDGYVWQPVPEDRDQAFIAYDGLFLWLARIGVPAVIKFGEKYPSLVGLSFNGWELDRQLLVELDRSTWISVAEEIQRELTDPIIEDAVRRIPAAHYETTGEFLTKSLKSRRDRLPKFAERYYKLITRQAEIQATDKDEYAELEHMDNGDLDVRIGVNNKSNGTKEAPYFQRTFHPKETKEVRLYLRGGKDHTEVLGQKGKIMVRVDGGGSDDSYKNLSQASAHKTRFYDDRGDNTFDKGNGAKIDDSSYKRPLAKVGVLKYKLDWGKKKIASPYFLTSPDLGLFFGLISINERYGYRKTPFASRHIFNIGLATKGPEPFIGYTATFRHLFGEADLKVRLEYEGINVIRFHGFGNGTEIPGSTSFYKVDQKEFFFAPSLVFRIGENLGDKPGSGKEPLRPKVDITVGPIVKYASTPESDNADRFIGTFDPSLYGTGDFGQIGGQIGIKFDTRDNEGFAKKGVLIRATGTAYPEAWDVEQSGFGQISGAVSTYLSANMALNPSLALRAGGQRVWGIFPFHEAAYLGGSRNLRGFRKDRFGGEASVYGNAELRIQFSRLKFLLPGRFGVFGAVDVGRVYLDGDASNNSEEWHNGVGGGIWFSFLDRRQTLSVSIMNGDDLTGVYLSAGFMY